MNFSQRRQTVRVRRPRVQPDRNDDRDLRAHDHGWNHIHGAAAGLEGCPRESAFETAMMPLRMARQRAIAERKQYIVCFGIAAPAGALTPKGRPRVQSVQIFRWDAGTALSAAAQITAVTLPTDIAFQTLAGLPNTPATVPDGFGNAAMAIDFDQGVAGKITNQVMFMPDGSAHDVNGNLNSGIVYVARNGDLYSSRAVTLYGATGRIRGWRLITSAGDRNGSSSDDDKKDA